MPNEHIISYWDHLADTWAEDGDETSASYAQEESRLASYQQELTDPSQMSLRPCAHF